MSSVLERIAATASIPLLPATVSTKTTGSTQEYFGSQEGTESIATKASSQALAILPLGTHQGPIFVFHVLVCVYLTARGLFAYSGHHKQKRLLELLALFRQSYQYYSENEHPWSPPDKEFRV
jgi:hypothetical protein